MATQGRKRMALRGKVVITCAVTGSIHTPTMSPHLPLTPDEITRDAIAAAEAGAAILHLHARDPKDGRPTPDPDVFMQFLPRIKQATDAVVNITTGGGHGMKLEERIAAALATKPEMASLNMGSMNFGLFPGLDKPPLFVQTIFGILGGIGADPDNLVHMRRIADKLFGDQYQWSVLAAGRHQMMFTTLAGIHGGNVRVGLEDSIYVGKGQLAKSNAEQVSKIRRILEALGLEIASADEAREMLALKGASNVGF